MVLEDTDGALHALVSSVWPDVTNDSPEKLQMLIVMLRRICTEKARSQPMQHCRSYVQLLQSHVAHTMHDAPRFICYTNNLQDVHLCKACQFA